MKIVFLNAWKNETKKVKDFILKHSKDTDIFCIQESLDSKSKNFCQECLPDYQLFFAKKKSTENDCFEQSTFIKKDLKVLETNIIGEKELDIGLAIFNKIITKDKKTINLCNVHGHAMPGHKQDTPERLKFSQLIVDFLEKIPGPKIVAGDFNLDLEIKSIQIFKDNNFRNLIEEFNIDTTRNHLSWNLYKVKQFFADHLFVDSKLKVKKFTVPKIEISDHLPMILEFDL